MSLILIAEDEEAMLDIFGQILEDLGHRVLRAPNGEEALMLARTERPDLVVSDHMMPRRTGMELLRALRADERLRDVPFLLLSAATPEGRGEADLFLAKPVDLNTFENAVLRMLREHASPEATPPSKAREKHAESTLDASLREEMLNWVAHEIKTPLSSARLNAQMLLRRQAEATDDERRYTEAILLQIDRMNSLVSSILDAARLSEGKMVLRPETGDLAAFLRGVVREWGELQPQVTFSLKGAGERVELSFDAERVRHILNNLLSNAVKYGGESRRVEVGVTPHPGLVVIEVRDWGQGISAAEVHHIFERFHRASGSEGAGHGLGLYIASALARLHGGSLSAQSTLGEGSTFSLRLPRATRA
ncbi:hybrid sensor histidine kinase/response regulator [Archangium primigenium]|uniref:ATP-binding response regulator n=1 Tax=[Archangium] primigenium TaxID=2792470 RepID=UPI0019572D74|nr:hybrid sensor histidine kinase/response regulator [Archangium primigenium]MBM7119476.1 hybrid sensor histidine kinase/response regulator [Archangium primigenium]